MNSRLLAAAILSSVLGLAHSYLGERYILVRLFRRDDLPRLLGRADFTKQTLRLAWHVTTVLAFGIAAVLIVLASPDHVSTQTIAQIISITFAFSGLVALLFSRGQHLSWIVFFSIAVLSWLGS